MDSPYLEHTFLSLQLSQTFINFYLFQFQNVTSELGISVESATSSIPVHGFVSIPSSRHSASISNLGNVPIQRAVATATARSSHHVHTAVVIASEEDEQSEVALQTAVTRAIAGAFAGSGEAAVANNIIDTTHRLQLWDSNALKPPDIANSKSKIPFYICVIKWARKMLERNFEEFRSKGCVFEPHIDRSW